MLLKEVCVLEPVSCSRETRISEAAQMMRQHHCGDLVVVDDPRGDCVPAGILTDRDIVVEVLAKGLDAATTTVADVGHLPFDAGSFDVVVSFTGVHCFPDPHRAIEEMVRVLAPGGMITGSSLFTDAGLRYLPIRRGGTRMGVLGPMCTSGEARAWLRDAGCSQVELTLHGALGYFRAVRGRGDQ